MSEQRDLALNWEGKRASFFLAVAVGSVITYTLFGLKDVLFGKFELSPSGDLVFYYRLLWTFTAPLKNEPLVFSLAIPGAFLAAVLAGGGRIGVLAGGIAGLLGSLELLPLIVSANCAVVCYSLSEFLLYVLLLSLWLPALAVGLVAGALGAYLRRSTGARSTNLVWRVSQISMILLVSANIYHAYTFSSTADPRCGITCNIRVEISNVQLSSTGFFKMEIKNDGNILIREAECTISGGLQCPPISLQALLEVGRTLIVEGSTGITTPIVGQTYTITITVSNPGFGSYMTSIKVLATAPLTR